MNQNTVTPSKIVKEFNAPRQLVFDAWTDVKHLNNWMFPMQGCNCEFVKADIKPVVRHCIKSLCLTATRCGFLLNMKKSARLTS
jgi:uncharacterized protein YndB with AHSA1/START domain